MKYKLLGRSGLRVSELCLGTMTFGNDRGWGASAEESRTVFDRFVDAGGNFFDTANVYQSGESERLLGEFIAPNRHAHVVATKYSLAPPALSDPNIRGNNRKSLVQNLEASLDRLGTDYVDILWVHAWDGHTADDELLRALEDVVRQGKALAIGLSDIPAWAASRLQTIAELRGWTPVSSVQFNYSLIERTGERELLPMARDLGMAMTVWGGLGAGMLSGKYKRDGQAEGRLAVPGMEGGRLVENNFVIADEVVTIAAEMGVTPSQVALAWLRSQSDAIIPLIGARTVEQLDDNLGCLDVELGEAALARLDAVSAIHQGFPREFLLRGAITSLLNGAENRVDARSRV